MGVPWWFVARDSEGKPKKDKHGNYIPDTALEQMLRDYQRIFIIDDPWACTVDQALKNSTVSTRFIMEQLKLPESAMHTGNSKRIAQICRDLGYRQKLIGGKRLWGK